MIETKGTIIQTPTNTTDTSAVTSVSNPVSFTNVRIKSYQTEPKPEDQNQSKITSIAYTNAGMTYAHIANAIEGIGGKVKRLEVDAPLNEDWENKSSRIFEDENRLLAWQKGEQIVINKLPSALNPESSNIIQFPTQDVVEIIGVSTPKLPVLEDASHHDAELANNPYFKKAA